jgi:hypothetical protein
MTQTHSLTLPNAARTYRVLDEVAAERARQHALLAAGAITLDCADPAVDLRDKFPVLIEETGEVAELMQNLGPPDTIARRLLLNDLRDELIHLAAVAVAIAESLTTPERSKFKVQSSELEVPPRTTNAVLTPQDLQPEDLNE